MAESTQAADKRPTARRVFVSRLPLLLLGHRPLAGMLPYVELHISELMLTLVLCGDDLWEALCLGVLNISS